MKLTTSNFYQLTAWIQNLQEFQLDSIFETSILARSYDYIAKVNVLHSQENKITCQITGTRIYDIELKMVGSDIIANCNCPFDDKCKHISAVILSLMDIDWNKI